MSTKYSYKPADAAAASTVIVLNNGSALEVRCGTKTTWAKGEARTRWASLAEWMDTLPAGAQITKSAAAEPTVPLSPEMARVVAGLTTREKNGYTYPLCGNLFYSSEKERVQRRNNTRIAWYRSMIAKKHQHSALYQTFLTQCEAQIAGASDTKKFGIPRNSTNSSVRLYCKSADGVLCRVWFNHRLGVFGLRDGNEVRTATTLAGLGFPADAELYGRRRYSEDIIKL